MAYNMSNRLQWGISRGWQQMLRNVQTMAANSICPMFIGLIKTPCNMFHERSTRFALWCGYRFMLLMSKMSSQVEIFATSCTKIFKRISIWQRLFYPSHWSSVYLGSWSKSSDCNSGGFIIWFTHWITMNYIFIYLDNYTQHVWIFCRFGGGTQITKVLKVSLFPSSRWFSGHCHQLFTTIHNIRLDK